MAVKRRCPVDPSHRPISSSINQSINQSKAEKCPKYLMPFVSLLEKERGKDMATIDPKKGHYIFSNALLSRLKDPIEKFIDEVLKPEGENVIRKMVQGLIDNPIGNPNLEHYWEQKMTVYFQKTVENDKQVRFGWLISQLKENIYGCMVALWKKYANPGVVFYQRIYPRIDQR